MEDYDHLPEIQVKVRQSTTMREPDDYTYRMTSSPRGIAVVINNKRFKFEKDREGSERDFKYLQQLFAGLGYMVLPYEDLTAIDMLNVLTNFAENPYHLEADSSIVAMSSHGLGKNRIQGTDGDILDLDFDITPLFNNKNCKALKNKPKLFFIQACRGGQRDEGTDGKAIKEQTPSIICKIEKERTPSWSDMMIVHSTIPGYVSNRHKCEGSWFVQSMVKTFMEDAWNTDIETMMKTVTKYVMKYKTYADEMQSPEVILRGWTKNLYFNPLEYQSN